MKFVFFNVLLETSSLNSFFFLVFKRIVVMFWELVVNILQIKNMFNNVFVNLPVRNFERWLSNMATKCRLND